MKCDLDALRVAVRARILTCTPEEAELLGRVDSALEGFGELAAAATALVAEADSAAIGKAPARAKCDYCPSPAVVIDSDACLACGPCFRRNRREKGRAE